MNDAKVVKFDNTNKENFAVLLLYIMVFCLSLLTLHILQWHASLPIYLLGKQWFAKWTADLWQMKLDFCAFLPQVFVDCC